jgi:molybdopterin converting factor small subunit
VVEGLVCARYECPGSKKAEFDSPSPLPLSRARERGTAFKRGKGSKMRITVECYGASQRWCGAELISLDLGEGVSVQDALRHLGERFPELAARRETLAVAIGDEIVPGARALVDGERIALIPPVSGG